MARGFWKGLLHGGALGVAGLAALSLAMPLSESPSQDVALSQQPAPESPVQQVVPDAPTAVVAPEPVPEPAAPAPVAPAADAGPDAGAIDLPVGSEFGRGDVAPVLPGPLTVPEGRAISDAPAVSAPAAEPSPVTVTAADPRPDAQFVADDGPERPQPAEGEAAPTLDLPAMQAAPDAAVLPDMGVAGQADLSPLLPEMVQEPAPQAPAASAPVAQAPAEPAPFDPAPADATAPDLSLPPSLSDFGGVSGG